MNAPIPQFPSLKKEPQMAGIKALVGKRVQKTVKFAGEEVTIQKLTVGQVDEIRRMAGEAKDEDDSSGLQILRFVIREAVEGGADLTDDDFNQFPMDELNKLSQEIMKHSGLGDAGEAKGK